MLANMLSSVNNSRPHVSAIIVNYNAGFKFIKFPLLLFRAAVFINRFIIEFSLSCIRELEYDRPAFETPEVDCTEGWGDLFALLLSY